MPTGQTAFAMLATSIITSYLYHKLLEREVEQARYDREFAIIVENYE